MNNKFNQYTSLAALALVLLSACNKPNSETTEAVVYDSLTVVQPVLVTQTTMNDTDDPAIWINPANPAESLILGTDKGDSTGGIWVFNLKGEIDSTRSVFNMLRPNNIDVEYGFNLNGTPTDIAVFTERGRDAIRVFALPSMRPIDNGGIAVFETETQRDPMGIALYKNPANGEVYAMVSRKNGPDGSYLWQYHLTAQPDGTVIGTKVRRFGQFKGMKEIEAIAVDDELGHVYYSDETKGVRQYYAHPDSSGTELALFATEGFADDHEGISIYKTETGKGYILVSDQGANRFQIFRREGTKSNPFEHRLVKIVNVAALESDGSEITEVALNGTFGKGLFVAMSTDRTFHYYRWEDIAGDDLK